VVGALGIVYGDIGTSPLYALNTALNAAAGGGTPDESMVLGVLSLVFWIRRADPAGGQPG
jgi:KUP system potassium uptake protein